MICMYGVWSDLYIMLCVYFNQITYKWSIMTLSTYVDDKEHLNLSDINSVLF